MDNKFEGGTLVWHTSGEPEKYSCVILAYYATAEDVERIKFETGVRTKDKNRREKGVYNKFGTKKTEGAIYLAWAYVPKETHKSLFMMERELKKKGRI